MAKTFMQMAQEAMAEVRGISALEAQRQMKENPATLVIDVRDAVDTLHIGLIPGALNVSLGMLPVRADRELPQELRAADLQGRTRPIITTCALGPNGARGARDLKEMGFSNVCYLEGGMQAWVSAGLPTEKRTAASRYPAGHDG
jgi:rhodanese-related sulfurtransferase